VNKNFESRTVLIEVLWAATIQHINHLMARYTLSFHPIFHLDKFTGWFPNAFVLHASMQASTARTSSPWRSLNIQVLCASFTQRSQSAALSLQETGYMIGWIRTIYRIQKQFFFV
jgi:hypothetical protein